jgi:hypothetical protein
MYRTLVGFSLVTVLGLAQTADSLTNQKVLEELKGVRATLARIMEVLEKGQRAQLLLARLQIDEGRVVALEGQRIQLTAQERELEKELAEAASLARAEESGLIRTAPGAPSTAATRQDQATRKLDEVRRARRTVDQALTTLRNRIATTEKSLEEALR